MAATLNTITTATTAPARADDQPQVGGGACRTSENTVTKTIGSGFHDGPPVVCRSRWTISRPQTSHDHGS